MTRNQLNSSLASDTPTVRLSGPAGIVAAVPQFLGFEPTNSLVVVCMRDPRGRVGPVVRGDLCDAGSLDALQQLVNCAHQHADRVAVVCYHDSTELPECVDTLLDLIWDAGVPTSAALSIHGGVIRDATSPVAYAADPGVPVPDDDDRQVQLLTAATALSGRCVLPSREALAASVAGPGGAHAEICRKAAQAAQQRLAPYVHGGRTARSPELFRRTDIAFTKAWTEQVTAGSVSLNTAADLIVLCRNANCRDQLIGRAVEEDRHDTVPMLMSVAGQCPDEDAPGLCSALAVTAYRFGDGALAHCAIDRVLAADPDNRMAHLVLSIMAASIPPSAMATMTECVVDPDEDNNSFPDDWADPTECGLNP